MADTRTVVCWESPYDSSKIHENQWLWQIAKKVATSSGTPAASNIIWKSENLAPTMSVTWNVTYGLNWTSTVPNPGVTVLLGGKWQECAKGQVYDLNDQGYWAPSQAAPEEGWMKVGQVNYQYAPGQGIHIIVGVKNEDTGRFDTIFVDSVSLFLGSSAKYQPQESVIWWYQGSNMTGQVYSQTFGTVGGVDLTNPAPATNEYKWWTTYTINDGKWSNSQYPPPDSALFAAPKELFFLPDDSTADIELNPIVRMVLLAIPIVAISQPTVRNYLFNFLSAQFTEVEVVFTRPNGNQLRISYGPPRAAQKGTREFIGFAIVEGDEPDIPIEKALKAALARGILPAGEKWTISKASLEGGTIPINLGLAKGSAGEQTEGAAALTGAHRVTA